MKTLYLRDVPDDVVRRLERLAVRDAISVSAVAVRELAAATRWADNAALLEAVPDTGVGADVIVADLEAGRTER